MAAEPVARSKVGEQRGAPVVQWAQESGELGGVLTSHRQLTTLLRRGGHEVRYVDTGSTSRAARALLRLPLRRALHLFHITRLWRAIVLAPMFAVLPGRSVLVLHSGSTAGQVAAMRRALRWTLWQALGAYDEIWVVNEEIRTVLPRRLWDRTTVVTPFDSSVDSFDARSDGEAVPCGARQPHALAVATNAGQAHYNADLAIEVGRRVAAEWPDVTLAILAYGNDGPSLSPLRRLATEEPWVSFSFDLPPADVAAVLHRVGTFLRPTAWDGDSIIVREALASGARVVASDTAPRPRGVEVAPLDADALAQAVLRGGAVSDGSGITGTTMSSAATAALERLRKH
ncbi:glycosyltransferase [Intrasporangium sp.]|uniref:glycosyltransferase n=1 Tax=Intrasporangium sp. TaxID=1925024 RepID=UPI0033657170